LADPVNPVGASQRDGVACGTAPPVGWRRWRPALLRAVFSAAFWVRLRKPAFLEIKPM
jgi:hypothetical protein